MARRATWYAADAADAGSGRADHVAACQLRAAQPAVHAGSSAAVLIDKTPIEDPLCKLQPLEFELVRRTAQERLFNSLMEEHHYLGYEQPAGEHLSFRCRLRAGP